MGIALRPGLVRVERLVGVEPAVVWRLLADVNEWPRWGPSVRRAVLDDGAAELGPGVRGTVWTAGGVMMPFTITDFQPGRRWGWRVAGVPATGHEVTAAPGGCRAVFEVPWWAAPYGAVCAVALARIERLVLPAGDQPPQ